MNIKMTTAVVLSLCLTLGAAAAQQGRVYLTFDAGTPLTANESWVSCGTCCHLVAEFPAGVQDFAILAAPYIPREPLDWTLLCMAPLPASHSVCLGGDIPQAFSGCCFAFVAVGATKGSLVVSETMVLHIK